MAEIMFISEIGMFHSAIRCTWGNRVEWYGFKPLKHRAPISPGMIDRSDRSAFLNYSVKFTINDNTLRNAVADVTGRYASKQYILSVCDCVSFTAEVARQVRLRVPALNFTPYGFIKVLGFWNPHE